MIAYAGCPRGMVYCMPGKHPENWNRLLFPQVEPAARKQSPDGNSALRITASAASKPVL